MNVTSFRRRLEALEVLAAPDAMIPALHPLNRLLDGLIAHHLGEAGPHDSIAVGMARGLGYDGPQSFRTALMAGSGSSARDDLDARWRDATTRLLALKDTVPDCDGRTFAATLEALYRELPDRLREHPFMAECEGLFEAA